MVSLIEEETVVATIDAMMNNGVSTKCFTGESGLVHPKLMPIPLKKTAIRNPAKAGEDLRYPMRHDIYFSLSSRALRRLPCLWWSPDTAVYFTLKSGRKHVLIGYSSPATRIRRSDRITAAFEVSAAATMELIPYMFGRHKVKTHGTSHFAGCIERPHPATAAFGGTTVTRWLFVCLVRYFGDHAHCKRPPS